MRVIHTSGRVLQDRRIKLERLLAGTTAGNLAVERNTETDAVDAVGALDRVDEGMGVGPRDGECEDSEAREHSDEK